MSEEQTYCPNCGADLEPSGGGLLWCASCEDYIDPDIDGIVTAQQVSERRARIHKEIARLVARKAIGKTEALPFE